MNYLASPPLCVAYALAGTMDIDLVAEPLGQDERGRGRLPARHLAVRAGGRRDGRRGGAAPTCSARATARCSPATSAGTASTCPTGERFAWDEQSTYVRLPPYFEDMPAEPRAGRATSRARACSRCSATASRPTTSRRPARSSATARPAPTCRSRASTPRDFNSYGSRRGNHEVMMRGTFANIRLRNQLAPGTEGGVTRHLRRRRADVDLRRGDALRRRTASPLVVLAGKEYGSGSSRDWAAKGTQLLGVRAVIAQSFERIHRSNLVGMGVLPLQFADGESAAVARPHRRGDVRDRRHRRRGRAVGRRRRRADGARARRARRRRAGRVRRARAHRHAARGRLLPPRRHPAVRPARAARRMSQAPETDAVRQTRRQAVPQLLLDLLAARGPSGYESAPAAVWREAAGAFAEVSTDVVGTPLARVAPEGTARRARARRAAGDGPHRRDRADRHPHRRRRLSVVSREVGGWDAQILVGQRVVIDTRERPDHGRGRQEADPPAARRGAQEGRRDPRPAHRHRRARRRAGARAACASATSP